jgi:hypothetical protein
MVDTFLLEFYGLLVNSVAYSLLHFSFWQELTFFEYLHQSTRSMKIAGRGIWTVCRMFTAPLMHSSVIIFGHASTELTKWYSTHVAIKHCKCWDLYQPPDRHVTDWCTVLFMFQIMAVQHSTRYWQWSCDPEACIKVNWLLQKVPWETGTGHQDRCMYEKSQLRHFMHWLLSFPPGKCWDSALKLVMTTSFHIPSSSTFTVTLPFDVV